MNQSIHGHEIIRMVHEADPPLTEDTLRKRVSERFGPQVQFHVCAGDELNLEQLLEFLAERGKVVNVNGQLRSDIGLMCDDEH